MAKKKKQPKVQEGVLQVAVNKQARRDFEITETFEAGIVLLGSEVKSIRDAGVNLKDSYVKVRRGELFLVGCHVSPYSHAPADAHDVTRDRKLLLHKEEIKKIEAKVQQKGLTIVPLRLYFKRGRCKLEFGLGRGKKLYDKREDVKKRDVERELARIER